MPKEKNLSCLMLPYAMQESADYQKFNVPMTYKVSAVLTLNANWSFPDDEKLVQANFQFAQ